MRANTMKATCLGLSVVAALLLSGCGGGDAQERPQAYEPSDPVATEASASCRDCACSRPSVRDAAAVNVTYWWAKGRHIPPE